MRCTVVKNTAFRNTEGIPDLVDPTHQAVGILRVRTHTAPSANAVGEQHHAKGLVILEDVRAACSYLRVGGGTTELSSTRGRSITSHKRRRDALYCERSRSAIYDEFKSLPIVWHFNTPRVRGSDSALVSRMRIDCQFNHCGLRRPRYRNFIGKHQRHRWRADCPDSRRTAATNWLCQPEHRDVKRRLGGRFKPSLR